MDKESRAKRRHHHRRMIEKAKNFFMSKWKKKYLTDEEYQKHLSFVAETKKPCSCHMCRNPRHSDFNKGQDRLTMQERKIHEKFQNDWENLMNDQDNS